MAKMMRVIRQGIKFQSWQIITNIKNQKNIKFSIQYENIKKSLILFFSSSQNKLYPQLRNVFHAHLCVDPDTVHTTSQHSFTYDGQSNNIIYL